MSRQSVGEDRLWAKSLIAKRESFMTAAAGKEITDFENWCKIIDDIDIESILSKYLHARSSKLPMVIAFLGEIVGLESKVIGFNFDDYINLKELPTAQYDRFDELITEYDTYSAYKINNWEGLDKRVQTALLANTPICPSYMSDMILFWSASIFFAKPTVTNNSLVLLHHYLKYLYKLTSNLEPFVQGKDKLLISFANGSHTLCVSHIIALLELASIEDRSLWSSDELLEWFKAYLKDDKFGPSTRAIHSCVTGTRVLCSILNDGKGPSGYGKILKYDINTEKQQVQLVNFTEIDQKTFLAGNRDRLSELEEKLKVIRPFAPRCYAKFYRLLKSAPNPLNHEMASLFVTPSLLGGIYQVPQKAVERAFYEDAVEYANRDIKTPASFYTMARDQMFHDLVNNKDKRMSDDEVSLETLFPAARGGGFKTKFPTSIGLDGKVIYESTSMRAAGPLSAGWKGLSPSIIRYYEYGLKHNPKLSTVLAIKGPNGEYVKHYIYNEHGARFTSSRKERKIMPVGLVNGVSGNYMTNMYDRVGVDGVDHISSEFESSVAMVIELIAAASMTASKSVTLSIDYTNFDLSQRNLFFIAFEALRDYLASSAEGDEKFEYKFIIDGVEYSESISKNEIAEFLLTWSRYNVIASPDGKRTVISFMPSGFRGTSTINSVINLTCINAGIAAANSATGMNVSKALGLHQGDDAGIVLVNCPLGDDLEIWKKHFTDYLSTQLGLVEKTVSCPLIASINYLQVYNNFGMFHFRAYTSLFSRERKQPYRIGFTDWATTWPSLLCGVGYDANQMLIWQLLSAQTARFIRTRELNSSGKAFSTAYRRSLPSRRLRAQRSGQKVTPLSELLNPSHYDEYSVVVSIYVLFCPVYLGGMGMLLGSVWNSASDLYIRYAMGKSALFNQRIRSVSSLIKVDISDESEVRRIYDAWVKETDALKQFQALIPIKIKERIENSVKFLTDNGYTGFKNALESSHYHASSIVIRKMRSERYDGEMVRKWIKSVVMLHRSPPELSDTPDEYAWIDNLKFTFTDEPLETFPVVNGSVKLNSVVYNLIKLFPPGTSKVKYGFNVQLPGPMLQGVSPAETLRILMSSKYRKGFLSPGADVRWHVLIAAGYRPVDAKKLSLFNDNQLDLILFSQGLPSLQVRAPFLNTCVVDPLLLISKKTSYTYANQAVKGICDLLAVAHVFTMKSKNKVLIDYGDLGAAQPEDLLKPMEKPEYSTRITTKPSGARL